MIKGEVKQDRMSMDEILDRTNNGYDIFRFYLGKVHKSMPRPWGKKESKPSWGVYPGRNGIWMWKDLADERTGNAITFVQEYFSLTPAGAMDKICSDFGLGEFRQKTKNPVIVTWEKPDIERDYCDIHFSTQPFTEKGHQFWNIAEVTEEDCKKMNYFQVKDLAINRRKMNLRRDEIVFAYYDEGSDSVKIYFPERDKGDKFRSNIDYHHLWNYENVGECDKLLVAKSNKDLLVTSLIFPCTIATQSEAVQIFNPEVVGKINAITKSPYIFYGSDWDGVKKCKEITSTNKWKYINTPKEFLPEVNDPYSFVKMHNLQTMGTGLRKLEEYMKLKKVI